MENPGLHESTRQVKRFGKDNKNKWSHNLHSEGFLDWGGGGGGITEFLYEPGLSPLSEVLDRDQSEVEPWLRLWPGLSSSESPAAAWVGVKMDIGRLLVFLSGVLFRVLG